MTSTILCITDFSDASKQILKQACRLAQQLNYHLTILYCYRLKITKPGLIADIKKNKEREALEQFIALEEEFIKGFDIKYDFRSEVGFLTDRVEEHLRREQVRFLIINKQMRKNNKELFDELLEQSGVPIILITVGDLPDQIELTNLNTP